MRGVSVRESRSVSPCRLEQTREQPLSFYLYITGRAREDRVRSEDEHIKEGLAELATLDAAGRRYGSAPLTWPRKLKSLRTLLLRNPSPTCRPPSACLLLLSAADASAIPSGACTYISCDKVAVSAADAHTTTAMISVKAPDAEESSNRAPLDLVLAIDVSGSMRGSKMRLMKQTLELLVSRSGLTKQDRIALVTFDSRVQLRLPH